MKWQGKVIDANGRVGNIEIEGGDQKQGRGKWTVHLAERDTLVSLTGDVDFSFTDRGLEARSVAQQKDQAAPPLTWTAKLDKHSAGRYAQAAYLGQYSTSQVATAQPMTNGVIVLWQFQ